MCAIPHFVFFFGSYSKIHFSSSIITSFKKFLLLWIRSRRWRHKSFRLSFCSIVRFLGTIFAHSFLMVNYCVKIWWTVVWFKFKSLAIIRTVSRRSDRTRARTFSTLLSVFEVEGLPEWDSFLMDSRPTENALYHLKTCDLEKACSPWAFFSLLKVSMPVSPSLAQNLIAHLCSKLRSSISVTHTKTASQKTALKLAWWC